jgi:1-deoxy-D-xylulose-5-phosphate reductoisomerase
MRFPILYALAYPERLASPFGTLDLAAVGALHFEPADEQRFPALKLARAALRAGGTVPAALNAANEVAVQAFLDGKLAFPDIAAVVEETAAREAASAHALASLEDALAADARARAAALATAEKYALSRRGSTWASG